jgi:FkbM family methyltransferase
MSPSMAKRLGRAKRVVPRPLRQRLRQLGVRTRGGENGAHVAASASRARSRLPAGALDCFVAANEHGVYCLPRSSQHRPASQAIQRAHVWEPDTLDLVRSSEQDGDVVHAGTFFGDFIPALARSRRDGAIVWAFEPSRENYRCAQITTLLNGLENVVLTHAALDAKGGSGMLQTSNRQGVPSGGGSRLIVDPLPEDGRRTEEVALVAIDEVLGSDRRVAVIQLDVEGNEQQALAGAMATIGRCLPLIVLEALPAASWIAENLTPLGYTAAGSVNKNLIMRPPADRGPRRATGVTS